MLNTHFALGFSMAFGQRFCRLAALAVAASLLITLSRSAVANPEHQVLLDLPINSEMTREEVVAQAESMVNSEISSRFASDPNLTAVEITVLGNRSGDIIPIVMTSVSRTDWQANPSVSAWSNYYRSYALFQRHNEPPAQTVATSPRQATGGSRRAPGSFNGGGSVDSAFDSGILPGRTLQANLDELD